MTTPALIIHKPRELTDALLDENRRLKQWLRKIRDEGRAADSCDRCNRLRNFAHAALSGWEVI